MTLPRILAVLVALAVAGAAHAHGGGLDDLGCHHNRKAGGYHCHRGVLTGGSFASKAEAVLELGKRLSRHQLSSVEPMGVSLAPVLCTTESI